MSEKLILAICTAAVAFLNVLFFFEHGHHFLNAFVAGACVFASLVWVLRIVRAGGE